MKILCDTNIILDVLLERQPFVEDSYKVLSLCEEHRLEGFVSASSVTDIYYLVRKYTHSTELAYQAVGKMLEIVKVCSVTSNDVLTAYQRKAKDFERLPCCDLREIHPLRLYRYAQQKGFRRRLIFHSSLLRNSYRNFHKDSQPHRISPMRLAVFLWFLMLLEELPSQRKSIQACSRVAPLYVHTEGAGTLSS